MERDEEQPNQLWSVLEEVFANCNQTLGILGPIEHGRCLPDAQKKESDDAR